ncbi:MAG: hypothetical protein A2X35_07965 [Elusimicrobia bacterium GWA2_61_42]|nr:MAG: hypothetical protein A2X35_07965 [Elusimicrobia bacterium GWA2_61_42]OGR76027.1 MAG: hypothetical protein A2X38_08275 [Elusimicrobia bacterium GWC2_61_25]
MKTAFLLLSLYAASPCQLAAGEFFPVCMYGITKPAELAVLKKAGFNCFQSYEQAPEALAALAAGADKAGLKMVAMPDRVIGSAFDKQARKWPMLAWYLYDEPEVRRLPLADLQALDKRVKDWAPGQRTAFVMGAGLAAFTYGGAADALMVDWYPVPHLPLESVGQQVTLLKEGAKVMDAANPAKPVWAVLQAFDWMEFPQRKARRIGRFPAAWEIRFMTYLALARGANGIFYFKYASQDNKPLPETPERWAMFEAMAAEVNRLGPLLAKGKTVEPPPGLPGALSATVFKARGHKYMILLNPALANVPVDVEALKGWRPLFEEKRSIAELLPGNKRNYFPPYRVLILEN